MEHLGENIYHRCLRCLLRPIARFCLQKAISVQQLTDTAKDVFLEVAADELRRQGEKVNVSRLSVITGLQRRDVMKRYRQEPRTEVVSSLPARVLGQWEQDPRFTTKSGKPRSLTYEGEQSEFHSLIAAVSRDVHPGTVLFQLERSGSVERTKRGVRLIKPEVEVRGDPGEGFLLLSKDLDDLIGAVQENLFGSEAQRNLHARTEYTNVARSAVPEIKRWLLREGTTFHLKVRNFLARYDLDINPRPNEEGNTRVVFGTFSRSVIESEE